MIQPHKQSSEKARAKGRRFFIWQEGILRFGIPAALIIGISRVWIGIVAGKHLPPMWELGVEAVLVPVIFGIGIGTLLWKKGERVDK